VALSVIGNTEEDLTLKRSRRARWFSLRYRDWPLHWNWPLRFASTTARPAESEASLDDLVRLKQTTLDRGSVDPGPAQQSHAYVQVQLRDLGIRLSFDVWIASNDQSRRDQNGTLGRGCLTTLPSAIQTIAGGEAVRVIDVLWLERGTYVPVEAFEVERSTSTYSGIARMLALAFGFKASNCPISLFLVAPDKRHDGVRSQLRRSALSMVQYTTSFSSLTVSYSSTWRPCPDSARG